MEGLTAVSIATARSGGFLWIALSAPGRAQPRAALSAGPLSALVDAEQGALLTERCGEGMDEFVEHLLVAGGADGAGGPA